MSNLLQAIELLNKELEIIKTKISISKIKQPMRGTTKLTIKRDRLEQAIRLLKELNHE